MEPVSPIAECANQTEGKMKTNHIVVAVAVPPVETYGVGGMPGVVSNVLSVRTRTEACAVGITNWLNEFIGIQAAVFEDNED